MVRYVLLATVTVTATGCATVRSHIPFTHHDSAQTATAAPFHRDPHRQYFDKLRKRYYYYDVARKSYFWENGQPKG